MPKFLSSIDLNKNELQNATLQKLATAPSSPVDGQMYFNTTDKKAYIYQGSAKGWVPMDGSTPTVTNISNSQLATMPAKTLKGNKNTTAGTPQDLTAAEVRALLNVADGATANQGTVTNVTVSAPLAVSNGTTTPAISIPAATTSNDGYMTKELVAAVNANTAKVSNANHTGDVTGSTTLTIANKAVTLAKMADLAANTIIGNNTASAGVPLALTPAQVRSMLNVASGAEVNQNAFTTVKVGATDVDATTKTDVLTLTAGSNINIAANASTKTVTIGINGVIPIANGGTGASNAAGALTNLGLTATAAELNVLDGITASTTELNYVKGVTSAIQTQLNAKAPIASPEFTGTPKAPTAAVGTSTTQLATTAFVNAEIANDAAPISHVGSGGAAHANATTSTAGFMSATDKATLNTCNNKKHDQNTDTGTTSESFMIASSGDKAVMLKGEDLGVLAIRHPLGTGYGDLRVRNIYIQGDTVASLTPTTVTLGDNIIELNSGVTTAEHNSDGGIAIKRLDASGNRVDAQLLFNESLGRFTSSIRDKNNDFISLFPVANKFSCDLIEEGNPVTSNGSISDISHGLNTKDVTVTIRDKSTGEIVYADVVIIDEDHITVGVYGSNYRVTVVG